jgi:hypothetical protein
MIKAIVFMGQRLPCYRKTWPLDYRSILGFLPKMNFVSKL